MDQDWVATMLALPVLEVDVFVIAQSCKASLYGALWDAKFGRDGCSIGEANTSAPRAKGMKEKVDG